MEEEFSFLIGIHISSYRHIQSVDKRNPEVACKAILYNRLPDNDDAEGRMAIKVGFPLADVKKNIVAITELLQTQVLFAICFDKQLCFHFYLLTFSFGVDFCRFPAVI